VSAGTTIWLVRHGEIGSYRGDHGLTLRGEGQARAAGAELAERLDADPVTLLHASSARATETALHVGAALRAANVRLDGPARDPAFDNFGVLVDGVVREHDALRVAIVAARERPDWPPEHPADWEHEGQRFAEIHEGGGDPITWWLTQPTLAYEPAARVVRRFWRGMAALARAGRSRVVVCTHSGPIRAVAAQAIQHDPGEPDHLEHAEITLGGGAAGDPATLRYRKHSVSFSIPTLEEPTWP